MTNALIATIDDAGRVVIPKRVRERAGWPPGTRLAVRLRGGRVELEPEPGAVRLKRRGSLLVAVHEDEAPELTVEQVNDTLERVRRREA